MKEEDSSPTTKIKKKKRNRVKGEKMGNPFVHETKIPENEKINNIFYN